MDAKKITQLLALINELVNAEGMTRTDKKRLVDAVADNRDKVNLGEFSAWFSD